MKIKDKFSITILILYIVCCLFPLAGCKKFIEVAPPVTSLNEGNVYKDDATAAAVLTGIYTKMSNSSFSLNLTVLPELSADNLALYALDRTNYTAYYQNSLHANDPQDITKFWLDIYPYIFNVNSAIAGITASNTLTPSVKKNLLGEAYFLRGFYYFYLVNLYGDVPLAMTTDYHVNNELSRTPVKKVYLQIIADLKQAQSFLGEDYLQSDALTAYPNGTEERVRPNRFAAMAMLARVYLYENDWFNAEQTATQIINKTNLLSLTPLDQVFLKNSRETIWALQPVKSGYNTDEGDLFTLRPGGPDAASGHIIYLSNNLMDSFQPGDQRKSIWTAVQSHGSATYPYVSKYKAVQGSAPGQEYAMVLRLGEQYLIRAEARLQMNNIADGIADLNILRNRAADKNADPSGQFKLLSLGLSKEDAIIALMYERRMELFCEWGQRWFDLKRTAQLDGIMKTVAPMKSGAAWKPYEALLPVPSDEIRFNPAINQNPGYTN